ncbi:septum formation protein [Rhodovulum iodosum]|uniref:Nucleoside triphosphate pyrophosphatase n=1 Tax=Rhodovulum iodosum TaxID=68291 RepID=A0ABV3XRN3_9RHOB|nr:Maf family nucleotide pyrophosphatase [Rhodovulum robiginosum]RSK30320.1 septum formation protein Maf [Rhodovulum robiginosum]
MAQDIILASGSAARALLLRNAGVAFTVQPARVDEAAIRDGMTHDGAGPREVAEALAEFKARRVAESRPDALVIGADQVLALGDRVLAKPETRDEARTQLLRLRGRPHRLLSAVAVFDEGAPLWRHVGVATLTMRPFSDTYLDEYLDRNWNSVRDSVGGYKLEEEGVRLFNAIDGDFFTVLGLPLLPLLTFLTTRGVLAR